MATSNSSNFTCTRDDVIARALRIVQAIGQGETPDPIAVTEATLALNMIVKERQADGMQLWKIQTNSFAVVSGTKDYNIGIGSTINQTAPLKVIQAWMRTTATAADSPMNIITKQEYDMYGVKTSPGQPSEVFYRTPGVGLPEMQGVFSLYPAPDANTASASTFVFTGMYPIQDFDVSTDNPDFPSYYFNALTWILADQLAYEYGVPLSERAMISKKATEHLMRALMFDTEEGSLYIQPEARWEN